MKKISFAILLMLVFCSVAVASIKDSPDGFRGIKWGDPPSALGANTLIEEAYGIQTYEKHNENLMIGEVNLTAIAYLFQEKKFIGTAITSKGADNGIALKTALLLRYGAEFNEIPGGLVGLVWDDMNATIAYQYLPEHNTTLVVIANAITFMDILGAMGKSTSKEFLALSSVGWFYE